MPYEEMYMSVFEVIEDTVISSGERFRFSERLSAKADGTLNYIKN